MESRPCSASKLKLPGFGKSVAAISGIKLTKSPNTASSTTTERPPGVLRRRSKSSSDLRPGNVETPFFIRKLLPTIHAKKPLALDNAQQEGSTRVDLTSNVTKARAGLRRRSKSATNLTRGYLIPAIPIGAVKRPVAAGVKNIRGMAAKSTVNAALKRPFNDNKSDEQPKPKVMKPRIPAYDYKARYQRLEEVHSKLKSDHEKLQTTFSTYKEEQIDFTTTRNTLKEQVHCLKIENENARSEIANFNTSNDKLTKSNIKFAQEVDDLNLELANRTIEIQTNNNTIKTLQTNITHVKAQLKNQQKHNVEIKQAFEVTKLENDRWQQKHAELVEEVVQLKAEVDKKDLVRQKLHNDVQDLKGNIRVFCRARPQSSNECKDAACIKCFDETDIEIRRLAESVSAITGKTAEIKQEFSFDRVFDENSTQADIFEELSQLVQSALDGYNVCVFAYGQTGSGKTYTMQGYDSENEGMIPRSLRVIFNYGDMKKNLGWSFTIQASFLEIYNETLNDLLNIRNKEHLEIYFNEGKGVSVKNLTVKTVQTYTELWNLMAVAHKNRTVAATDFNLHSSRSHAVTQIHITAVNPSTKTKLTSVLSLVDLAGSESAKTSAQDRLAETKCINKSLSTLGTVMNDLGAGKTHIPYRNSKLTFLLQSCLGGNSKTLMIVHISPNDDCYGESVNSLRFAAKVRNIKTASRRNRTAV